MDIILKYFPDLSGDQIYRFRSLESLYRDWNNKINVISRKDIDHLYERHVLHSLSIAKLFHFVPGTRILDVGTGGGFPGIPLAIFFPQVRFTLVDSIGKKIRVVSEIVSALSLTNTQCLNIRAEQISDAFDFIVSRAVSDLPGFCRNFGTLVSKHCMNDKANGIIYLKGGDIDQDMKSIRRKYSVMDLSTVFDEPFFETKKLVHLIP